MFGEDRCISCYCFFLLSVFRSAFWCPSCFVRRAALNEWSHLCQRVMLPAIRGALCAVRQRWPRRTTRAGIVACVRQTARDGARDVVFAARCRAPMLVVGEDAQCLRRFSASAATTGSGTSLPTDLSSDSGSFFDVFDVKPTFDLDLTELANKYRDIQRKLHPDVHASSSSGAESEDLAEASARVNHAYSVLKSPYERVGVCSSGKKSTPVAVVPSWSWCLVSMSNRLLVQCGCRRRNTYWN